MCAYMHVVLHLLLDVYFVRSIDKFFELLLREAKLDANAKNNDGDTPLHLACRSEKHSLVQLLVREAKLDANAKNNDGDTPLHLACRRENFSLVQLLVRDGRCNPNEKNSDGDSALHVVCFQHPSGKTQALSLCTGLENLRYLGASWYCIVNYILYYIVHDKSACSLCR